MSSPLEVVITGSRRKNAARTAELAVGSPNSKAHAIRILLDAAAQHNNGGPVNALTNSLILCETTAHVGPYAGKPSQNIVSISAALPPGLTKGDTFKMTMPFDTKAMADQAADGLTAAPGVKVLAACIQAASTRSTLRECVPLVVNTLIANSFTPDPNFLSVAMGYVGAARNMPDLAARVAAAVSHESFGPAALLAGMNKRYAQYAAKGSSAAAAVAILKRHPDFTFPTLPDGTPIASWLTSEAVIVMHCATIEQLKRRLPNLTKAPLKIGPQRGARASAIQLLFNKSHSTGTRGAGNYASLEAALRAKELIEAAGDSWFASLLIIDVCAVITDPAKRTPAEVGAYLAGQLSKWGATLDAQTLPFVSTVVEIALARPSNDASAFDMASPEEKQAALALIADKLGAAPPQVSKNTKIGYLHESLKHTLTLKLADVGVTGDLASKPAIPLEDKRGVRTDPIETSLDLAITADALSKLKDLQGGTQLKVYCPQNTTTVMIGAGGLDVNCGNAPDVATAKAYVDALRKAPQAVAARVVQDVALLPDSLDAKAAEWAKYVRKSKLQLHPTTTEYLAAFLAQTVPGATAGQLLDAVAAAHAGARAIAESTTNSRLYLYERSRAWGQYKIDFAAALEATKGKTTAELPLCPVCRVSRLAVGATSDNDKTKRSCVVVAGEKVDACLRCSFYHNSPDRAAAVKRAQTKAALLRTPEGRAEMRARLDKEAAAQGFKPLNFIVKWG